MNCGLWLVPFMKTLPLARLSPAAVSEAVPIAEVFRFASQNCRWQGERSREYFVYFKIFQRSQRQFGPQSWVLRLLVQLLRTLGMVVVPCSMKTVAGVVSGYSDNLLLRAADVCLKERRKLVLCARESPLSTVHLRNLYEASKLGAVIAPPMLTYYNSPQSLADCTCHTVNRILSQFDLDEGSYQWEGMEE